MALFERAWQIAETLRDLPPDQHSQAIRDTCGDDSVLRKKVAALLSTPTSAALLTGGVHDLAGDALAQTAADLIDDVSPGDQIGAYRLIEELGAGGMSRVYLAVREGVEFEQKVAVKLMRALSTSRPDSRVRFEREQRVLANLHHPHIARIVDGGLTPSGRPFLVMEYVNGLPITEYCQTHALDLPARLNLFSDICVAVEHAHRNLVVHRDLKPSNILVDQDGQVKLLDFGIAKILDDADNADLTQTGLMMLTPQYAAPEQVTGAAITTATDVYALGLILYELLVDARAWRADGLSVSEQLVHICDTTPVSPSSVVPSMPWSYELRGDLDLVVAKALAKSPGDRYPSCTELVRDLQFWQRGLPVSAHAPSAWYRLKKFSRRHWVGLSAAVAVLSMTSLFIGALITQQNTIKAERNRAQDAQAATGAVNRFLIDELLGAASTESGVGRDVPVSLILERAEETAGRAFSDEPLLEVSVRETLSRTYLRLGDLEHAALNLELGQRRLADAASSNVSGMRQLDLVAIELQLAKGDIADAYAAGAALLAELESELDPEEFDVLAVKNVVARAQYELDDWPPAERNFREVVDALERRYPDRWRLRSEALFDLAKVLYAQRDTTAALENLDQRLAIQQRHLGEHHPDIVHTLRWQATALSRLQRRQEALVIAEKAHALALRTFGKEHLETTKAAMAVANGYVYARRFDEAIDLDKQTVATLEKIQGANQVLTLNARQNLGVTLSLSGRLEEAEVVKRQAAEAFESVLGERHSRTLRALRNWATTLQSLGRSQEHRRVVTKLVRISKSFEHDVQADPTQINDAASYLLHCEPHDLRDPVTALAMAKTAVEKSARQKGQALGTLGQALMANQRPHEAIEILEESAALDDMLHRHALVRDLAQLYLSTGQIERAEGFFAEHQERRRAARGDDDWLLGVTWHEQGRFYVNAQLGGRAIPVLHRAIEQFRLTREEDDQYILRAHAALGAAQSQIGETDPAERHLLMAYDALKSNSDVLSEVKREIVAWLIDHYTKIDDAENMQRWRTELAARVDEPRYSDWSTPRPQSSR